MSFSNRSVLYIGVNLNKTFSFNVNFDLVLVRGSALNRYHMKIIRHVFPCVFTMYNVNG